VDSNKVKQLFFSIANIELHLLLKLIKFDKTKNLHRKENFIQIMLFVMMSFEGVAKKALHIISIDNC
jgi:hypothetical protein